MRSTVLVSAFATAMLGMPAFGFAADEPMQIPVNKGSVQAGDGQAVMFRGSPLPLTGKAIKVGEPMPSATLTGATLAPVNIADGKGKVRIINIVPSLDTPTCDAQTHELVEKDPNLASNVELVTVSMDLPFAQARWGRAAQGQKHDVFVRLQDRRVWQQHGIDDPNLCTCLHARSSSPTRTASCVTCRSCRRSPSCQTWMRQWPRPRA